MPERKDERLEVRHDECTEAAEVEEESFPRALICHSQDEIAFFTIFMVELMIVGAIGECGLLCIGKIFHRPIPEVFSTIIFGLELFLFLMLVASHVYVGVTTLRNKVRGAKGKPLPGKPGMKQPEKGSDHLNK